MRRKKRGKTGKNERKIAKKRGNRKRGICLEFRNVLERGDEEYEQEISGSFNAIRLVSGMYTSR
eukprot:1329013-Amorphochlora_amoeboformis.AAC.1